ncbi:MAG: Tetratricopeptide 2 repeat protein [Pedosphaera sp.]|nr:Tetratricopeptide 2 repeat protein [Pedosphaera sp.]
MRAYNNRGLIYCKKEMWSQAIVDFSEVIRVNPQDASAYQRRGMAYHQKNKYDEAISDSTVAIRLDPKMGLAYSERGYSYCYKSEFEKGIADFKEAIRVDPKNSHAYNNLAWFRATCPVASIRNGKEALEAAQEACALTRGKNATVIDTLAAAYAEVGNFNQAILSEKHAIKMGGVPEKRRRHMKQALLSFEQHQPYREVPD